MCGVGRVFCAPAQFQVGSFQVRRLKVGLYKLLAGHVSLALSASSKATHLEGYSFEASFFDVDSYSKDTSR